MRERILDAAEELFAEHGFDGVTVRQVTRKASVDVALAHYYFGTKKGLFDSVFLRRAAVINEARLKSMDDYQINAGPGGATIEGFIQAFLDPIIERCVSGDPGWRNYLAIVAQVNNTPKWGGETMARYFDPVILRLIDALRGIMPGAHEVDLYWSYHFLSGALTLTFAQTGRIDLLSSGVCQSHRSGGRTCPHGALHRRGLREDSACTSAIEARNSRQLGKKGRYGGGGNGLFQRRRMTDIGDLDHADIGLGRPHRRHAISGKDVAECAMH